MTTAMSLRRMAPPLLPWFVSALPVSFVPENMTRSSEMRQKMARAVGSRWNDVKRTDFRMVRCGEDSCLMPSVSFTLSPPPSLGSTAGRGMTSCFSLVDMALSPPLTSERSILYASGTGGSHHDQLPRA